MSYAARLIHDLTLVRTRFDDATSDAYGQPSETTTETSIRGLVQPRVSAETQDPRSAGAAIADHVIFLPLMTVEGSDAIVYGDRRFAVTGVRRFDFGTSPHLEVDARTIIPPGAANDDVGS